MEIETPGMTAGEVLAVLERKYAGKSGAWVFLREVRIGTGWGDTGTRDIDDPLFMAGEKRIDAWALSCWPSTRWESHAFEVKISRADLRHELAHPEKRAPAMRLASRFYFVLAPGVKWDDLDLPSNCGVLIAGRRGITVAREAERRFVPPLPWSFVASALRRATGWRLNGPAA